MYRAAAVSCAISHASIACISDGSSSSIVRGKSSLLSEIAFSKHVARGVDVNLLSESRERYSTFKFHWLQIGNLVRYTFILGKKVIDNLDIDPEHRSVPVPGIFSPELRYRRDADRWEAILRETVNVENGFKRESN